ncbi:MAG: CHASE2 domain-containing protein, partial [Deltaproteobacteria bacterium]|nr:CHASE2 domain-containing protein [Deltaproteobacteria bacterium]
ARLTAPTNEFGRLMVNYRGSGKTFPHISVTDILHHRVPPEILKDKIVLVGATATGIYDLRVTPFSNVFPGLEIQSSVPTGQPSLTWQPCVCSGLSSVWRFRAFGPCPGRP